MKDLEKEKEMCNFLEKKLNQFKEYQSVIEKIKKIGSIKFCSISSKYKGLVESCLSNIKDIMIHVELMDKELVTIVSERGEGMKSELLKMRNKRQAAMGYKTVTRYPAKFLDTRR